MGRPVRFALCVVGLLGVMLAAMVPMQVSAASAYGKSMGPIPKGLPGPEEISFPARYAPGTIVVVVKHRRLYYVTSRGRALRYVVGVGREGMNWKGTAEIARKAEWPSWTPPAEMHARAKAKGVFLPQQLDGGTGNPLGARALYLYNNVCGAIPRRVWQRIPFPRARFGEDLRWARRAPKKSAAAKPEARP